MVWSKNRLEGKPAYLIEIKTLWPCVKYQKNQKNAREKHEMRIISLINRLLPVATSGSNRKESSRNL
jgi:hypothetical protein